MDIDQLSAKGKKVLLFGTIGGIGLFAIAIVALAMWASHNWSILETQRRAEFDAMVATGREAIRAGDMAEAEKRLVEVLDFQRRNRAFLDDVQAVAITRLSEQCRAAGSDKTIVDTIVAMTAEEYKQYVSTGRIEGKHYFDDPDVNAHFVRVLESHRSDAARIRAEDAKRKPEERKQQELAEKEAERERQRQAKAPPTPVPSSDIDTFRAALRSADKEGLLIVRVSEGTRSEYAVVTVANAWHYQPYQIRYQTTQNFWTIWAQIHSPGDVDKARIKIVDLNGNEVGGSRMIAGSMIWVDK